MVKLEILNKGKVQSVDGRWFDVGDEILNDLVETFNPKRFRPPLILTQGNDHDVAGFSDAGIAGDDNKPPAPLCHGIPSRVQREGDKLVAQFDSLSDSMRSWLNKKLIPGFSSSFYLPHTAGNPTPGKYCLRHIASVLFPAAKGMDVPGFSESLEPAILGEADESLVVLPAVSTEKTAPSLSECDAKTEPGDKQDFESILAGMLPDYLDRTLAGYFQNLVGAANFDEASSGKYDSLRTIVQAYKNHHNLTLADIAKRAGVSNATISRVLSGSQNPSPPLARNLARIVGVDPAIITVLEEYKTEIMATPIQVTETDQQQMDTKPDMSAALAEAQAQLKTIQADLEQARAQAASSQKALESVRLEKRRGEAAAAAVKLSEFGFSPGDNAPSFSEADDNALEAFVVSLSEEQAGYFTSLINSLESPKQPADEPANAALFSEYTAEESTKPEILGDSGDGSDPIEAARIKAAELYARL